VDLGPVTNVFYFVADLDAAKAWYEGFLDISPVEVQPQLATYLVAGTRLTLHRADEFNSPAGLAGTVAYWGVEDVDAAVSRAVERGAVTHRGPKTIFTGERLCQLRDPFGNLFGLRQGPPR
jgi:predicted enzyme related to lactoylglutathione lyase